MELRRISGNRVIKSYEILEPLNGLKRIKVKGKTFIQTTYYGETIIKDKESGIFYKKFKGDPYWQVMLNLDSKSTIPVSEILHAKHKGDLLVFLYELSESINRLIVITRPKTRRGLAQGVYADYTQSWNYLYDGNFIDHSGINFNFESCKILSKIYKIKGELKTLDFSTISNEILEDLRKDIAG